MRESIWTGVGEWFGVDTADMGAVLPNHDNFAQSGRLSSEADTFTSDRSDFSERCQTSTSAFSARL
jgi:hypothetical protein